jgi:hypothetical protein
MNHRIVSAVVASLTVLLVLASVLFAGAIEETVPGGFPRPAGRPPLTHTEELRASDCFDCHKVDVRGGMPLTHVNFGAGTCESCHEPLPAPEIPHATGEGVVGCVACHGLEGGRVSMPRDHLGFGDDQCGLCHAVEEGAEDDTPPAAGDAARRADDVPHPVEAAYERCRSCHVEGDRTAGMPEGHVIHRETTCLYCHVPAARSSESTPDAAEGVVVSPVPHPVDGRYRECRDCHSVGGAAGMPANHAELDGATCRECHLASQ